MRIAVCISGAARNWEACAEGLREHVLSKYDCDVFIHTWHHQAGPRQRIGDPLSKSDIVRMKELYSPTVLCIEPQRTATDKLDWAQLGTTPIMPSGKQFNACSMFYSMYRTGKMMEVHAQKHGEYDYVIKSRFDVLIKMDLQKIFDNVLPGTPLGAGGIIALSDPVLHEESKGYTAADTFIAGTHNDMYILLVKSYEYLESVSNKGLPMEWGPEEVMYRNLYDHGIRCKSILDDDGNFVCLTSLGLYRNIVK